MVALRLDKGALRMTPWVIDANDIVIRDVESFRASLLQGNAQIVDFLASANKTEMLIVAPKGYGKTLLLKAKRQAVQQEEQYAHILPVNNLVDKPGGIPNIPDKRAPWRQSEEYWKILWLVAIGMTFLKAEKAEVSNLSPKAAQLWADPVFDCACDIFTQLLQFNAGEYERLKNDCMNRFVPHMRQIRHSACLFIDNVDEFFEEVLKYSQTEEGEDALPRAFWYQAQIGVALAAREIHALNSHLKTFASIRKEAFESLAVNSSLGLQLSGAAMDIIYSYTDLLDIIDKNINEEKRESLPNPEARDAVAQFFVDGDRAIMHNDTDDEETLKDFWLRHTLRRPRDIAAIGRKLSDVDKGQRTIAKARKVISAESAVIARHYLAESTPHLDCFDATVLLPLLTKNYFHTDELEKIAQHYMEDYKRKYQMAHLPLLHPFCHLFKLGLLGYVRPVAGDSGFEQQFPKPGSQSLSGVCVLPAAEVYLIHPIMDAWLAHLNPAYVQNKNQLNVIGHRRVWRESNHLLFVLKGDVEKYSRLNRNPDRYLQFDEEFDRVCMAQAAGLAYGEVSGGDSVTLVDPNPRKLILCAQRINVAMGESVFKVALRFGGACGRVDFISGYGGVGKPAGVPLNDAARIEPHVKPGRIFVSHAFVEQARHMLGAKALKTRRVTARQMPKLPYEKRQFNFAKPGSGEPAVWKEVFAISAETGV